MKMDIFTFMEASRNSALVVDSTGAIVYLNSKILNLFGYNKEELLNEKIEILIPERFRERHVKHRKEFCKHPEIHNMADRGLELYGRRKDGSEFRADIMIGPLNKYDAVHTDEQLFIAIVTRFQEGSDNRDAPSTGEVPP
jgi:PAS domain S-box-containing protein